MAPVRERTGRSGDTEKTAWIVDYMDQDGIRRLKTFKTKKEADAEETKIRHEVSQGTHTADSASVTVAEAAERWIKGREIDGVERSTRDQYRQHIDLHINPLVGNVKLSRLTTPRANQFKEALLETRSRAMAGKVLQSFRSLIADAQGRGQSGLPRAHRPDSDGQGSLRGRRSTLSSRRHTAPFVAGIAGLTLGRASSSAGCRPARNVALGRTAWRACDPPASPQQPGERA